jgi:hypothetical protein
MVVLYAAAAERAFSADAFRRGQWRDEGYAPHSPGRESSEADPPPAANRVGGTPPVFAPNRVGVSRKVRPRAGRRRRRDRAVEGNIGSYRVMLVPPSSKGPRKAS